MVSNNSNSSVSSNNNKISWGQLLLLLLVVKIFTLMTFVPLVANGYTPTTQILATVISAAIQAVLITPLIFLSKKHGGKNLTGIVLEKSKILGTLTVLLYLGYFFIFALNSVLHFQRFINEHFFPSVNEYLTIGVFLIICAYCAHLGISGLSRSGVLLFIIFIVTFIVIAATSYNSYDSLNFYYDESYKSNLFRAVLDDLVRNGEIVALVFLAKYMKNSSDFRKASYGLLAAKPLLSIMAAFLIIGILGEFAAQTNYPLLAVSAHAGIRYIGRSDAIFMVLWTITSVIAVSLMINIGSGLVAEILPKSKFKSLGSAAAVFIAACYILMTKQDFSYIFEYAGSGYVIALLVFLIPLTALTVRSE